MGGAVLGQSLLVSRLFCLQRAFLHTSCGAAAGSGGPGQQEIIRQIQVAAVREANSPYCSHLAYVADTVDSLGWIVVSTRPYKVSLHFNEVA